MKPPLHPPNVLRAAQQNGRSCWRCFEQSRDDGAEITDRTEALAVRRCGGADQGFTKRSGNGNLYVNRSDNTWQRLSQEDASDKVV